MWTDSQSASGFNEIRKLKVTSQLEITVDVLSAMSALYMYAFLDAFILGNLTKVILDCKSKTGQDTYNVLFSGAGFS